MFTKFIDKPRAEIRSSLIPNAGMGIFATEDIEKGDPICIYDGVEVPKEFVSESDYLQEFPVNGKTIDGFRIPRSEWGIGQFANDAVGSIFDTNQPITSDILEKVTRFFKDKSIESEKKFNVVVNPNGWLLATRFIKKGEELYNYYGINYWLWYNVRNCKKVVWRLIFYLALKPEINFEEHSHEIIRNILGLEANDPKFLNFGIDPMLSGEVKLRKLIDLYKFSLVQ